MAEDVAKNKGLRAFSFFLPVPRCVAHHIAQSTAAFSHRRTENSLALTFHSIHPRQRTFPHQLCPSQFLGCISKIPELSLLLVVVVVVAAVPSCWLPSLSPDHITLSVLCVCVFLLLSIDNHAISRAHFLSRSLAASAAARTRHAQTARIATRPAGRNQKKRCALNEAIPVSVWCRGQINIARSALLYARAHARTRASTHAHGHARQTQQSSKPFSLHRDRSWLPERQEIKDGTTKGQTTKE